MKKILLIFVGFLLLNSCDTQIEEVNIVTIVTKNISTQHTGKYVVALNQVHMKNYFYTDSLYQVGDTLYLTLKQN